MIEITLPLVDQHFPAPTDGKRANPPIAGMVNVRAYANTSEEC